MHRLTSLLRDGVARRDHVVRASSATSVGRWIRQGDLVVLHPGVLAVPERATEWSVRATAATLWADGPLSHLSALRAAGLTPFQAGPVHVTVPLARCPRDAPGVIAHRSDRGVVTIRCGSFDVVEPARSLVDAWAWAHAPTRNPAARSQAPHVRQALIEAVRGRVVRPAVLQAESDRRPLHPGRAALADLLGLVGGGCESELEIWGVTHVLPGPPITPPSVQQHPVHLLGGRTVRLDAAYLEARVAVELDGAAFHGSSAARERDLRRDTALAALGWVVLRFSYARLMADPDGCRREIEAVVRRRLANR